MARTIISAGIAARRVRLPTQRWSGWRNRQIKNFLTLTLLAIGTPMLLMGDEVRRTQGGNNNGFCQNNEIFLFDWSLVEKHADIHRFVQGLIALRMNRDLPVERLDMTLNELLREQRCSGMGST
jgi:isoamylase